MRYKRVQTALNGRYHYFFGLHLVFKLIAKTEHGPIPKLKAGDCGKILYEKKDNKDPLPIGMFIGEVEGTPNLYRAVLLQHSIKEIEHIYPHYLGNTKLIRDKYARENSYTRQGPRETRSDPSTILPSASDPH
ncbi:hypothetical protein EB796_014648 [Bugula neritina]|uniref:Uncharacterized protein n=1 Tax=Bugula neritina TaxID=10212 RepID=A0A7J7JLA8_BUGNE|nr:hypothetical protein EB796_014648 [Bugula neritina]